MPVEISSVAGVVAGRNPLLYEPTNPITLFIFQAIIIVTFCQLLHYPLSKIKQPKVIAEVLTGIILGPSVFGHIPNFTSTVFPPESILGLSLVANVGLILFLFIVGLEVDIQFVKRNIKIALTVGMINMIVPFGFGCILAIGLYNDYESGHKFTTFMVFIAVAMCITAFPVLARILTELRLLQDRIGTIVLAAGITNDVVGWMLLALSVTLANAGNGVTTVYILLLLFGWLLVICFPVRWILRWCLIRINDFENGPSQLSTCGILILVFISSFYTDIIGIHPIFGAFLIGCIIPRDNGYVVRITEKIEDLVTVIIIPLYFTLAGLRCNLSSLDQGRDWGYIVCIIVVAMVTKIIAGAAAGKMNGLFWRESFSVGVLMSCKGIVEIVVLTTGLNAGIINDRVFSMFIVMALVCTFLTSPLTLVVYPVWYREKVRKYRAGEINWDGTSLESSVEKSFETLEDFNRFKIGRVVPVVESLSDVNDLVGLLHFLIKKSSDQTNFNYNIETYAVSLKRLTQRLKDIIDASNQMHTIDEEAPESKHSDSLLLVLKLFCELNGNNFDSSIRFYTDGNRTHTISEFSTSSKDFLLVPISKNADKSELLELTKQVKCNLGLFLNNLNPVLLADKTETEDDALTLTYSSECNQKIATTYDSLKLILTNEVISNDLLSLHIFLRFVSSLQNLQSATIYVMSSEPSPKLLSILNHLKETAIFKDISTIFSDKKNVDFIEFVDSDQVTPKTINSTSLWISSLFVEQPNSLEVLASKSQTAGSNLLICSNVYDRTE